jgi:hypothetical protein
LYPDLPVAHHYLALNYHAKGLPLQAAGEWLKAQTLSGANPKELAAFRRAFEQSGMRGIFKICAEQLFAASKRDRVKASAIGEGYADAGETELALQYFEQGYRERDDGLVWLKVMPALETLRADARFQDLIRRVGLP